MKELKAVEILQDLLGYEEEEKSKIKIREALAELKELTQEKSCEGCYFIEERNPFYVEGNQPKYTCRCPENFVKYVEKDFYCNHYTPKG